MIQLTDEQLKDYLTVEIFKTLREQQTNSNEYLMDRAVEIFQRMKSTQKEKE